MKRIFTLILAVLLVFSMVLIMSGCQGEQGLPGEKGEQGAQGIQGEKGDDGVSIIKTEVIDGYLWITYSNDPENPVNVGKVSDNAQDVQEGTDGLDYYPLPDGTYGVKAGNTLYLEHVEIPSTYKGKAVTQILDDAFKYAINLKSITIPPSITNIAYPVFSYCPNLESVYIYDIAAWCEVNCDYEGPFYVAENLYLVQDNDITLVTDIVITEGVAKISNSAFRNYENLRSVTIPESVTSIGDSVFSGCSSLTSVVIPDSVTSIGYSAFYGCSSLTSIVIPEGVTSIGNYAFRGCSSLTSIVIPDSVISIGSYAFSDCTSLTI